MIPVLDSRGMRNADKATIEGLGVPSMVLMESAAWAVTEAVLERAEASGRVVVVCGPGNNGGDGLAVSRQLHGRGVDVEVVLLVEPGALKGDARAQFDLVRGFGVPLCTCSDDVEVLGERLAGAALIVDALFGTGLDRPLEGLSGAAVAVINATPARILSVDMPSGLSGSRSQLIGPAVQASVTVTFAAPKLAHVLPPACWLCGEVVVADIGIPPWVLEEQSGLGLLEEADIASWLPRRAADSHKGHFGHLGVIAGRKGRAGAAVLAARAAVVGGAGLVTVATSEVAMAAVQAAVPEAMVDAMPAGEDGELKGGELGPFLDKISCLAIGPGIGTGTDAAALVDQVVESWDGPLVLDADALTVLAGRLERLRDRRAPVVLTPHPGELARLLGVPTDEVVADRLESAREAARRSGAIVLAKGARTLIAGGGSRDLVNPTGTPGLASGGAGDTLTGLIGALLAQGLDAKAAAGAGAFLHGRAAELAGVELPAAVPAHRLIEFVPEAWREAVLEVEG